MQFYWVSSRLKERSQKRPQDSRQRRKRGVSGQLAAGPRTKPTRFGRGRFWGQRDLQRGRNPGEPKKVGGSIFIVLRRAFGLLDQRQGR